MAKIRAPAYLKPATKRWWRSVAQGWELDEHHLRVLTAAGQAWDRYQEAREALVEHGLVFLDAKGVLRPRPEVSIERESRTAFLRALRELDLDVAPPAEEKRPPALRAFRGGRASA